MTHNILLNINLHFFILAIITVTCMLMLLTFVYSERQFNRTFQDSYHLMCFVIYLCTVKDTFSVQLPIKSICSCILREKINYIEQTHYLPATIVLAVVL